MGSAVLGAAYEVKTEIFILREFEALWCLVCLEPIDGSSRSLIPSHRRIGSLAFGSARTCLAVRGTRAYILDPRGTAHLYLSA